MILEILIFSLLATPPVAPPTCPNASAHVLIADYDGPVEIELCVSSMNYAGNVLHASLYAPDVDGIFRNGFEAAP